MATGAVFVLSVKSSEERRYKGQTVLYYKYGISQAECCIFICMRISCLIFLQIGFSVDGTCIRDDIIDERMYNLCFVW